MGGTEAVQQVEQDAVAGCDRAVEADLAPQVVSRVGELEADLVPLLHGVTGVTLKSDTRRRQLDGSVVTIEQRHIELGFELSDVA